MNPGRLLQRAADDFQRGRHQAALEATRRLLRRQPRNGDALHLHGLVLDRLGRHDEALESLRRAARLAPGNGPLWRNLGITLLERGQPQEALAALTRAIELMPTDAESWYQRGNAHLALDETDAARDAYEQALRRRPDHPPTLNNLAVGLFPEREHHEEAERLLRRAVALAPDYAEAWSNLGELLVTRQRLDEARAALERAVRLAPDNPIPHYWLGTACLNAGDLEAADAALARALELAPEDPAIHTALGILRYRQERRDEAEALLQASLELEPNQHAAWNTLGALRHDAGDLDGAEPYYRRALELEPRDHDAHNNLGLLLHHRARFEDADIHFQSAIRIHPGFEKARNNLALMRLATGDYTTGFREYVHRPSREENGAPPPPEALPEDLGGRRLLLIKDQGIGDELFFLRFLPRLLARGARVTYLACARLAPLLRRHLPAIDVITERDPRPPADLAFSIGDLPHLLGVDANDLPPPLPLEARADYRDEIARLLARLGPPPYLGLTWRAGSPRPTHRTGVLHKAAPPEALMDAVRPWPGTFVALQRLPKDGELARLERHLGHPLLDLTSLNDDLEAILAALELMDDYVAVSNTNVHLRAGLGKPSRILVPSPPEWRWGAKEGPSPWFPDHPTYRQRADGDWSDALHRLRRDLEHTP